MRLDILAASFAALGLSCAQIHLNLSRKNDITTNSRQSLLRRDVDYKEPVPIQRDVSGNYFVTVVVGHPGQTLGLQLRSDSYTTKIPSSNATYCKQGGCSAHGAFNQNLSSSFVLGSTAFEDNYKYLDGSLGVSSAGYNFSDTLAVGDLSVSFTMNICYIVTTDGGIFGIGYSGPESVLQKDNLVVQMVSQGKIQTEAYSLWLNDVDSSAGSLLLGAIDTEKYDGSLVSVDSFAVAGLGLWIQLSSLQASSPSGTDVLHDAAASPLPLAIIIGSTHSWLPQDLAQRMWAVAGAEYVAASETAAIPCGRRDSAGTFDFRFGSSEGPLIRVPLRHFVLPAEQYDMHATDAAGDQLCVFTIQNVSDPSRYHIAEDFMGAAYLVVDMYNQKVAMAQALYDVTDSNVVAFGVHGAAIPSANRAGGQPALTPTRIPTTATFTALTYSQYAAASGFASTTSASGTGLNSPSSTGNPNRAAAGETSGLSTGTKIGIGVGVPVGATVVAVVIFLLWRIGSNRHPTYAPEVPGPDQPMMEMLPKDPIEVSGRSARASPAAPAELSPDNSPRPNRYRVSALTEQDAGSPHRHVDWFVHDKYSSLAAGPELVHELDTSQRPRGARR